MNGCVVMTSEDGLLTATLSTPSSPLLFRSATESSCDDGGRRRNSDSNADLSRNTFYSHRTVSVTSGSSNGAGGSAPQSRGASFASDDADVGDGAAAPVAPQPATVVTITVDDASVLTPAPTPSPLPTVTTTLTSRSASPSPANLENKLQVTMSEFGEELCVFFGFAASPNLRWEIKTECVRQNREDDPGATVELTLDDACHLLSMDGEALLFGELIHCD